MPEFMRQPPEWLLWLLWASFALVVLRVLWTLVPAFPLYLQAKVTNTPIGFWALVGFHLRAGRAGMRRVVRALIVSTQGGLGLSAVEVEALHLSGGDVSQAVAALLEARRAGLDLTWQQVAALQQDGQDILAAVKEAASSGSAYKLDQMRARVKR